jgi:hypothetical protein
MSGFGFLFIDEALILLGFSWKVVLTFFLIFLFFVYKNEIFSFMKSFLNKLGF